MDIVVTHFLLVQKFTAKESLNALVGREIISIDGLVNDLNVSNPVPASKEEWARKAVKNNFRLQAANLRKFASKNNARSVASNHLPKVFLKLKN